MFHLPGEAALVGVPSGLMWVDSSGSSPRRHCHAGYRQRSALILITLLCVAMDCAAEKTHSEGWLKLPRRVSSGSQLPMHTSIAHSVVSPAQLGVQHLHLHGVYNITRGSVLQWLTNGNKTKPLKRSNMDPEVGFNWDSEPREVITVPLKATVFLKISEAEGRWMLNGKVILYQVGRPTPYLAEQETLHRVGGMGHHVLPGDVMAAIQPRVVLRMAELTVPREDTIDFMVDRILRPNVSYETFINAMPLALQLELSVPPAPRAKPLEFYVEFLDWRQESTSAYICEDMLALPDYVAPGASPFITSVITILPPLFGVDAARGARLVAEHALYHHRLGINGTVLYERGPYMRAFLDDPRMRPLLERQLLVLLLWDTQTSGTPLSTDMASSEAGRFYVKYDQHVLLNHAAVAFSGMDMWLYLADMDDYLRMPTADLKRHSATLQQLSASCMLNAWPTLRKQLDEDVQQGEGDAPPTSGFRVERPLHLVTRFEDPPKHLRPQPLYMTCKQLKHTHLARCFAKVRTNGLRIAEPKVLAHADDIFGTGLHYLSGPRYPRPPTNEPVGPRPLRIHRKVVWKDCLMIVHVNTTDLV